MTIDYEHSFSTVCCWHTALCGMLCASRITMSRNTDVIHMALALSLSHAHELDACSSRARHVIELL